MNKATKKELQKIEKDVEMGINLSPQISSMSDSLGYLVKKRDTKDAEFISHKDTWK